MSAFKKGEELLALLFTSEGERNLCVSTSFYDLSFEAVKLIGSTDSGSEDEGLNLSSAIAEQCWAHSCFTFEPV